MKTQDYKRIIRKAGIEISHSTGSRVSGWSGSTSKGVDFSEVFPWSSWYVRNGYRLQSIISDRTQEMKISEIGEGGQLDKVRDLLKEKGIGFVDGENEITVEVENPFSESDIRLANERWEHANSRK
jgi:hypothetical protein